MAVEKLACTAGGEVMRAVSYTHLDVYKRQLLYCSLTVYNITESKLSHIQNTNLLIYKTVKWYSLNFVIPHQKHPGFICVL